MDKKHFLVTGGAGFLGINLIRFLLEKGHAVTSLDVVPFDYEDCMYKIRIVTGDIRKSADVNEAMKGVQIVIHAAAALPLYSAEDILSTDVDGTRNIAEAAFHAHVERLIHISSTAVYGLATRTPMRETDPLVGIGPYGKAKIMAEDVCLEYRKKGMCIPIVRPKTFIGPERLGIFALFFDWARSGHSFPLIGNGMNKYQFLDVADLNDAIYLTATLPPDVVNDTFNVGAAEYSTMREDYQAILDRAGFGKKIRTFPAAPVIWALRTLEALHLSPVYRWVYETAATDSYVSNEKAERILGFAPRFSNKDALTRNYDWYLANLSKFKQTSGVSHRVPWKQGILRLAKQFF